MIQAGDMTLGDMTHHPGDMIHPFLDRGYQVMVPGIDLTLVTHLVQTITGGQKMTRMEVGGGYQDNVHRIRQKDGEVCQCVRR